MTETVSGARGASTRRQTRAPGLRIERVYTTPGVHPYDAVTWDRRDVVMTNWRDGSLNFEQRGVGSPAFGSANETTTCPERYSGVGGGPPSREHSLRQLIDRVVKRYRAAGEQH